MGHGDVGHAAFRLIVCVIYRDFTLFFTGQTKPMCDFSLSVSDRNTVATLQQMKQMKPKIVIVALILIAILFLRHLTYIWMQMSNQSFKRDGNLTFKLSFMYLHMQICTSDLLLIGLLACVKWCSICTMTLWWGAWEDQSRVNTGYESVTPSAFDGFR